MLFTTLASVLLLLLERFLAKTDHVRIRVCDSSLPSSLPISQDGASHVLDLHSSNR
jgi:hypothetical protein